MQQHYELIVLVNPQVADSDLDSVLAKIRELLTQAGASVTGEEALGKRKLAYPIRQARQGTYHVFEFDAATEAIAGYDREFRLSTDVLRHLITIRRVQTAEELEREQALRAKIEARRRQAALATEPKPEPKPEPERKVDRKELDEKLEKILEDDMLK